MARAAAARPAVLRVHHSTSASSGNLQTVWEEEEDDKWGPLVIERRELSNFLAFKGIKVFLKLRYSLTPSVQNGMEVEIKKCDDIEVSLNFLVVWTSESFFVMVYV